MSTLAEQIAWLRLEIQRREMTRISGAADPDTSMTKAILDRLEGLAAPGETPADDIEAAREALHQISRFSRERFARDHAQRALDRMATLEGLAAPGETGRVVLDEAGWQHFIECMTSPAGPSPAMIEAAKLHRQLTSGKPWGNKTVEHWKAVEHMNAPDWLAVAEQAHADAIHDWNTEGNEADLDECIVKHFAEALAAAAAKARREASCGECDYDPDKLYHDHMQQPTPEARGPQCEPLPDLIGLCTQIDSVIVWVREQAAAKARREAFTECAKIARGGEIADHLDCGHEVGYRDGRLDAEAAIRALSPTPQNPGDA